MEAIPPPLERTRGEVLASVTTGGDVAAAAGVVLVDTRRAPLPIRPHAAGPVRPSVRHRGVMVTITDVAAHAGVGAGTVSRVLNNSPRVRPDTRERVLAAIKVLDYRPNPAARALSRGRLQTVGVVVPCFTHASAVERLRGVVAGLGDSRYDLVLFNIESPEQRNEHFSALTGGHRADGLIVMSLPPPAAHLARLRADDVPIVLVDAAAAGVPSVVTDDVEGGRIATRHLVALGHRDIAFVGDDPDNAFGFTSSADRERGFAETLADADIRLRRSYVRHCPHDRTAARRATERLLALAEPPTAVFAASDTQATGVLEAAREHGVDVPRDLSIVGFDDIEISAYAGLTTVRQPLFESGRLGARLLLDALETGRRPDPEQLELPLELVERSTTAPPSRRSASRG